jgi:hypothetical protein
MNHRSELGFEIVSSAIVTNHYTRPRSEFQPAIDEAASE